ncbi:MAG TPA: hypothetical protein VMV23_03890 [Candidatus Nanopelagicaceae bacterium]|nr:hypothetical protein [Candidatus Nanopelagicaceae bacterium]
MRRKTFDALLTSVGAMLTLTLIVAGALMMWGAVFTQNQVHNQLAAQKVFFPTAAAFTHAKAGTEITPGMKPYLLQYAGQQVLTGAQAEAYADHFIAVHLSEMPYHGVYSLVSSAARAATPGSAQATQMSALETTSFQGTTLRSMLLEAYAFGTVGQIALVASIVAFVLAAITLFLTLMGYLHLRRTSPAVMI